MSSSGEILDERAESVFSWRQVHRERLGQSMGWQDSRRLPHHRQWSRVTQSTLLTPNASHSPYHQFLATTEDDRLSFAPSSLEMFHTAATGVKDSLVFSPACVRNVCSLLYCSDPMQAAVSALYAKLLIILGLALPLSEVLSNEVSQEYFHLFYVYLFLVSILYLVFVYIDLIQTRARYILETRQRRTGRLYCQHELLDAGRTDSLLSSHHPPSSGYYGSFYLRLGTVVFGIGSLIYTGMELADVFEENTREEVTRFLRPSLQIVFIFCQMYFVFLNQKMNIYKRKFLTRLGLMHLIATNICVWLKVLVLETQHELLQSATTRGSALTASRDMYDNLVDVSDANSLLIGGRDDRAELGREGPAVIDVVLEQPGEPRHILHQLVEDIGPFLFPCTIEFSLICAAVLFIMWRHVSAEHEAYKLSRLRGIKGFHIPAPQQRYSVDCGRASTGLFLGIVVVVVTIISLILFFVFISEDEVNMQHSAVQVAVISELAMYGITGIATVVGMVQMRRLWHDSSRTLELDSLLLIVAQTGVFIYAAFSIIGAFFKLDSQLIHLLASLCTLAQTTLQTVFILDASCRVAYTRSHVVLKPGRQVVTFLIVCNLAMWLLNTLETSRTDAHPMMVDFYGGSWAWPMISHIAMPLAIFYRFHSTVCLFEIWKKSFKLKHLNNIIPV